MCIHHVTDPVITYHDDLILTCMKVRMDVMLVSQIDEVVKATKAAQVLVEEAHREIMISGIRPVLRLASLDAKIPLSMLRLPSDPASPAPIGPSPFSAAPSRPNMAPGSPSIMRKAQRRVSWNSQQLAQVMSEQKMSSLETILSNPTEQGLSRQGLSMADVAQQRARKARNASVEAMAGSPIRDLDVAEDQSVLSQPSLGPSFGSESSSGQLLSSNTRRSIDRRVSPFALYSAPSQS